MHICSYRHQFDNLPSPVREALEDESYRTFMESDPAGPARTPLAAAPAIEDSPRSVRQTVRRLLRAAAFDRYTQGNHAVSERLAHEAVSWCDTAWALTSADEAFAAEENALRLLETSKTLDEARIHLPPAHRHRADTLAGRFLAAGRQADMNPVEERARIAQVAASWRAGLEREREEDYARKLGKSLGSFVRDLIEALPVLVQAQAQIRDLFGNDDVLWDLERGQWTSTNWDALSETAELLRTLPELDRLAEILGRSTTATEIRTVERVSREVTFKPVGLGKSEVTGVNFGDDLTSLLPSEVALLADRETEDLFYAKLAHKEMLQLDYRRERLIPHVRERRVPVSSEVEVPRGPVIVCLDTSGSMLGDPESIAKAMMLALTTRLAPDGRDLHLIAFSTSVKSLTLRAEAIDLPGLCDFLGGSFHGGTDLRPALASALETLEREAFRNADVLVISDFRIPKIADRFITRIKDQQGRGTLFHSLTIARGAVNDPLNIFDNSWLFDVSEGTRGIRPDTLSFLT